MAPAAGVGRTQTCLSMRPADGGRAGVWALRDVLHVL